MTERKTETDRRETVRDNLTEEKTETDHRETVRDSLTEEKTETDHRETVRNNLTEEKTETDRKETVRAAREITNLKTVTNKVTESLSLSVPSNHAQNQWKNLC